MTGRSVLLFVVAAVAEIGGATLQPDNEFGRVLAAYGGIFVAGSLLWGVAFDGFRPDRYDLIGSAVCLIGGGDHHVRAAPRNRLRGPMPR